MTRKYDEARGSANAQSNEGLDNGRVDRSAAGHTGAMSNLKNLLAHKLDAAFWSRSAAGTRRSQRTATPMPAPYAAP